MAGDTWADYWRRRDAEKAALTELLERLERDALELLDRIARYITASEAVVDETIAILDEAGTTKQEYNAARDALQELLK